VRNALIDAFTLRMTISGLKVKYQFPAFATTTLMFGGGRWP
jgi:hypothetical protein